jgi:glycosyltransferase involved in cell wall biosynthesis
VVTRELPSFDLVVATIGRAVELQRFLDSLEQATYRRFRVLVVDQNEDARLDSVLGAHTELDIVHLRSPAAGLSRARNRALTGLQSDVVAFPDDDCIYAPDLLERVAHRFASDPTLDGLTGRAVAPDGASSPSWKNDAATLTDTNLWNRAISYTIFLRRDVVSRVGRFDEALGLGSGRPSSSGEEIDYLIRAVRGSARIEYDPKLTVMHAQRESTKAIAYRDGASVGYLLRKHGYGLALRARMLIRPLGGALLSIARLDATRARFHLATLRGRIAGYRQTS